jgi:hypothetical protein
VDGQLVKCGWEQNLYLVIGQTLRDIPDWENWLKKNGERYKGRSTEYHQQLLQNSPSTATPPDYPIRFISRRLCDTVPLGPPVPEDSSFWTRLETFLKQSRANFLFYVKNKLPPDLPMA